MFTCTCAENLPGGQASFRVIHRMEHGVIGEHDHEFHELALVHEGRGTHAFGGKGPSELKRGLVIVAPEGVTHQYNPARTMCVTNVLIGRRCLARLREQFGGDAVPHAPSFTEMEAVEFERLEDLASRVAATQDLAAGREMEAEGLFLLLIAALRTAVETPSRAAARAREAVAGALTLVETRLSEPLDVAAMADATELGERTFIRMFKQATGYPPLDYLLRRRLARAADRLRVDDAAVTEIAFACGFNDSNYFARQFRRVHGCSPTAYRLRSRS